MTQTMEPTATEVRLVKYEPLQATVAKLREQNARLVFNYESPAGAKEARSHIYSLRQHKGDVERVRKELKAYALEYGRKVDQTAKALTGELDEMIAVHQRPLDEIAEREAARVAAIQDAMDNIVRPLLDLADDAPSVDVAKALVKVEGILIDADVYQERMAEATKLKAEQVQSLQEMFEARKKREDEAAELERLRQEAAARERAEREAQIAAEAEARAKAEAEAKAKTEREAAAKREQELKEAAERAKREAEEAAIRAKEDADRRVREAEEAAARKAAEEKARAEREAAALKAAEAKRVADEKHVAKVKGEAAKAMTACGVSLEQAEAIVEHIASGNVPSVTIRF